MSSPLDVPPLLYTPDQAFQETQAQTAESRPTTRYSTAELCRIYEVERTAHEIKNGNWTKVALQFPDEMLKDAPAVFEALSHRLQEIRLQGPPDTIKSVETKARTDKTESKTQPDGTKLYILGDTSYGACCVDEIAAEHADAEVVVHYGRTCLSPTARLPVIYVFTDQELPPESALTIFRKTFPDTTSKVVLMADVMHTKVLGAIAESLARDGYAHIFTASPVQDSSSPLPNRTMPEDVKMDHAQLAQYSLFHILEPRPSLLLTLASRVASIHIVHEADLAASDPAACLPATTASALRRRYALVVSLATVSIFGILINTLSVKNYLDVVERVKQQIGEAGKKSYTFVVGKVNAAKLANFSEIGGWVVIGCWESSLIESKDFFKPIITPFELQMALKPDHQRIWTNQWSSSFNDLLQHHKEDLVQTAADGIAAEKNGESSEHEWDSEPESAPPDFDLRSGRHLIQSRLMRPSSIMNQATASYDTSSALIQKSRGGIVSIGGQLSPGADFLLSKRSWRGLGSDLEIAYDNDGRTMETNGAPLEQGISGIARGYKTGSEELSRI